MATSKGFPAVWLARCATQQDRDEFKEYLLNCRRLFNELDNILAKEETSLARSEIDYDCPSWSHKQAHINGARETLAKIRSLIP